MEPEKEKQPAPLPRPEVSSAPRQRDGDYDLEKDLLSRLGYLRQAAREAGHNYVVNLEFSLISLADAVKQLTAAEPGKKQRAALKQAIELIDAVKLKPAKGRRKDLKRIEQAIAELEKLLIKKKT